MQPGTLVRIKPEYEGYGCYGLGYIVSPKPDAVPLSDVDALGPDAGGWSFKTYSVLISSFERFGDPTDAKVITDRETGRSTSTSTATLISRGRALSTRLLTRTS